MSRGQGAVAVRGETMGLEVGCARGDDIQHRRTSKPADDLHDPVWDQFRPFEAVGDRKAERDGGIEVAAGNSADGKGHGQHGQAERESDADESDAEFRKSRSEHGTAAASEYEPEGSEEFRSEFPRHPTLLYDPSQASIGILRDFPGPIAPPLGHSRFSGSRVRQRCMPQPSKSPKDQLAETMAASKACPSPLRWLR